MNRRKVRRYPRVSVNFPVDFTFGENTFHAHASTLGGGGLFLTGLDNLEPGTAVTIQFRAAKHLPLMEAKARICYQLPGQGVALEFVEIQPEHRHALLRLIHHKIGNKRRFPRAGLATQIECQQSISLAFSRDVSLGGMFIETPHPLPVDTRLNVRFHLDDDGPVVVALGQVTYQILRLGMGIQFVDLSPDDRKRVEAYVTRCGGPPDTASAGAAS